MAGPSTLPDRIMKLREFAQFAGVSYSTAKLWIRAGTGPRVVRLPGLRRIGIRQTDYAEWLDRLPEREPTARPTTYRGRRRASPNASAAPAAGPGRAYSHLAAAEGERTPPRAAD
jgi:predicted DNA-binding transcriptional regulator AlpA